MKVTDQAKVELLQDLMGTIMGALGHEAEGGDLTADDIIDFFALAIASVIDNDTNLKTPRDLRLGAQTAGTRIAGWAKTLRERQPEFGGSILSLIIANAQARPGNVN